MSSAKEIINELRAAMWRPGKPDKSVAEVAELLGVRPATVWHWQCKNAIPQRARLKIEKLLKKYQKDT